MPTTELPDNGHSGSHKIGLERPAKRDRSDESNVSGGFNQKSSQQPDSGKTEDGNVPSGDALHDGSQH